MKNLNVSPCTHTYHAHTHAHTHLHTRTNCHSHFLQESIAGLLHPSDSSHWDQYQLPKSACAVSFACNSAHVPLLLICGLQVISNPCYLSHRCLSGHIDDPPATDIFPFVELWLPETSTCSTFPSGTRCFGEESSRLQLQIFAHTIPDAKHLIFIRVQAK